MSEVMFIYRDYSINIRCLVLRPHGEINDQGASAQQPKKIPSHGVQTLVAVAAADDPARKAEEPEETKPPGGDGEVESRARW